MRIFQRLAVRHLFYFVIVGSFVCGNSIGSAYLGRNTIQGRVLKVSPPLGFWTGIAESLQWVDIKVVESRVPEIKPGVVLHIGVPVVKGNPLFDAQAPRFAGDKVAPGKLLELEFSAKCCQTRGSGQYVVEPTCIRVLK